MLHKLRLQMYARLGAQRRLYFWQTVWNQERLDAQTPTSGRFTPPHPAASWPYDLDPDDEEEADARPDAEP